MSAGAIPFHLDLGARGRRFGLRHVPASPARSCIVYVHPFAEEMNKSRRMAAACARALAAAGHAVLQFDLLGCGDSDGDLGDATWDDWVLDTIAAARWLQQRHHQRLVLWGLRSGALIAAQAASRMEQPTDFVFWQPAARGDPLLQQFLRLKVAAQLHGEEMRAKESTGALRAALESGVGVEVAGYRLAPALALGLSQASLQPPARSGAVAWFELSPRADATLLPASTAAVERWRSAGYRVEPRVLPGPSFWSTVEIEEAPALVEATIAALATSVCQPEQVT